MKYKITKIEIEDGTVIIHLEDRPLIIMVEEVFYDLLNENILHEEILKVIAMMI